MKGNGIGTVQIVVAARILLARSFTTRTQSQFAPAILLKIESATRAAVLAKWTEFQRRYRRELDAKPEAVEPILKTVRRGRVTLVYSSRDAEHNNAVVPKAYVEGHISGRYKAKRAA